MTKKLRKSSCVFVFLKISDIMWKIIGVMIMNIELKPTYENIIKTIKNDILGRNITLKRFVKALYLMKGPNIKVIEYSRL